MRRMKIHRPLPLLVLLLSLAACSSTKLISVYEAPDAGGPYRKLLVVGLGASEGGRAEFENAVADKLAAQGVVAVASENLIASQHDLNREAVRRWVETDGYDAVLVARLVDVKKEASYRPPTYTDFYGYWGIYGSYVTSPGYFVETTTIMIETTLFDAKTGRVVYTAQSESFQPSSREKLVHELAKVLAGDLTKRGLLPAPAPT
jgi:hypothetical protein